MLEPKKLANGHHPMLLGGTTAQAGNQRRVLEVHKCLDGGVAIGIQGEPGRAFMKPAEAYKLAQVLLRQIGMELPDMDGLL
jgi:hypothetical protein